jgi:C1A family cysteine protease
LSNWQNNVRILQARTHIAKYGAAVASIDSTNLLFSDPSIATDYRNQIIYKQATAYDHAVALFGWGIDGDQEYFMVQNSWGQTFGNEGTVLLDARSIGSYYGCIPSETKNP